MSLQIRNIALSSHVEQSPEQIEMLRTTSTLPQSNFYDAKPFVPLGINFHPGARIFHRIEKTIKQIRYLPLILLHWVYAFHHLKKNNSF